MKACAFFGHRNWGSEECKEEIKNSIIDLIENYGVAQFYSGGRGNFDNLCSQIVCELKKEYPHLKNTLVFSYIPQEREGVPLPRKYDDSVYLLEKWTPKRYAIIKTNEEIVKRVDFVVAGIVYKWGGAYRACEYAMKKGKRIIWIKTGR